MLHLENENLHTITYPVGYYLEGNLSHIDKLCIDTVKHIDNQTRRDVVIYCMGSSGSILSTFLSIKLKQELNITPQIIHLKKDGEKSHGASYTGDFQSCNFNMIIDDFMCSGATLNTIYQKIWNSDDRPMDLVALTGHFYEKNVNFPITTVICQKAHKGLDVIAVEEDDIEF